MADKYEYKKRDAVFLRCGSYIFLQFRGESSLGHARQYQICKGGRFRGATVMTTPENFAADVKRWIKHFEKGEADE